VNCGNYHVTKTGVHCPFCTIRVLFRELQATSEKLPKEDRASADVALSVAAETMRYSRETL
jgi:hypothetical protein